MLFRSLLGVLGNTELESVFLKASFKSDDVFLGRRGPTIVTGGGAALISFSLEEK